MLACVSHRQKLIAHQPKVECVCVCVGARARVGSGVGGCGRVGGRVGGWAGAGGTGGGVRGAGAGAGAGVCVCVFVGEHPKLTSGIQNDDAKADTWHSSKTQLEATKCLSDLLRSTCSID